jgi:hypothetical protein
VREEISKGLDLDLWLCSTFELVQARTGAKYYPRLQHSPGARCFS